jgi:N4-(beta-N-acetylglucosaminyl)-L-asparaginase
MNRRWFLRKAGITATGLLALGLEAKTQTQAESKGNAAENCNAHEMAHFAASKKPVIITKVTKNPQALDQAHKMLASGADTLEAALHVNKTQEDDPNDDTVGLGGLPNQEGVVELDACVMHGPTRRGGAVGGVRNIKNVCLVAKAVMEHTGHVMLAGEGAERFAVAMGFPRENLLTDRSRKIWLLWKENSSGQDWWGPGLADPNWKPPAGVPSANGIYRKLYDRAVELGIEEEYRELAVQRVLRPPYGTIHTSCVNAKGELSGSTTTSGLAWKIPGRLGDSPIIGAGCYTDQDVGSAGATGSGEENIKVVGAHTIVENMRRGMSPTEAGLDALRRIGRNYNNDMTKIRFIDMMYYILRKDGEYAGVSLWSGPEDRPKSFAVHDGEHRIERATALFQGVPIGWPPIPALPKRE